MCLPCFLWVKSRWLSWTRFWSWVRFKNTWKKEVSLPEFASVAFRMLKPECTQKLPACLLVWCLAPTAFCSRNKYDYRHWEIKKRCSSETSQTWDHSSSTTFCFLRSESVQWEFGPCALPNDKSWALSEESCWSPLQTSLHPIREDLSFPLDLEETSNFNKIPTLLPNSSSVMSESEATIAITVWTQRLICQQNLPIAKAVQVFPQEASLNLCASLFQIIAGRWRCALANILLGSWSGGKRFETNIVWGQNAE